MKLVRRKKKKREEAKKLYRKKRANGTNKEIKSNR